jgi:hypothetical protein
MNVSIHHLIALTFLFTFLSCSHKKEFIKENVCSPSALSYMKNSTGRKFVIPQSEALRNKIAETQAGMQQCYQDYMIRTGHKEFQTCMVVGVDSHGKLEYYNFSAQDTHSDRAFIQCAVKVTKKVPFWQYGKNYILLQSYNFY